MSDLNINMNPEMLDEVEAEFKEFSVILELAIAGANGDPQFDEVIEKMRIRIELMDHIIETMKMENLVNNEAKFEM